MGIDVQLRASRPTRLYLARHGETEYNRLRVMQGRRINAALNASGREQAEALGQRFASVHLDAVYASTLFRAIQTAGAVVDRHPSVRNVRVVPEFDEMSWGRYEGMPPCRELDDMLERTFAEWERGEFDRCIEDGESILQVQARAVRGIHALIRRHEGEHVLVVAHGRLIRVLLASILPAYGLLRMNEIGHGNTSVNELLIDSDGCRAQTMNCVRHLEAQAA